MSCLDPDLFKNKALVENFSCIVGHGILYRGIIDHCGHTYCPECFSLVIKNSNEICPLSRLPLMRSVPLPIKVTMTFLDNEELKCLFYESGCQWHGILKNLDQHISEDCHFMFFSCKNQGCLQANMKRTDLAQHKNLCIAEIVGCIYCNLEMARKEIYKHLRGQCLKYAIRCGHCSERVVRDLMDEHLKHCPKVKRACKFKKFGCSFLGIAQEMERHMNEASGLRVHLELQGKQLDLLNTNYEKLISLLSTGKSVGLRDFVSAENFLAKVENENDIFDINLWD